MADSGVFGVSAACRHTDHPARAPVPGRAPCVLFGHRQQHASTAQTHPDPRTEPARRLRRSPGHGKGRSASSTRQPPARPARSRGPQDDRSP